MRRLAFWKLAEAGATITSTVSFCAGWGLWMHFAYTRPTAANAPDGRVFPLDTHGWRVYLNSQEHSVLMLLIVLFIVSAATAIAIDRLKNPFRSK